MYLSFIFDHAFFSPTFAAASKFIGHFLRDIYFKQI